MAVSATLPEGSMSKHAPTKSRQRKPQGFFDSIKGKTVKVYVSVTDPVVFFEGILKDFDDSTFLLETLDKTILINPSTAIAIEAPKDNPPQDKGGHPD